MEEGIEWRRVASLVLPAPVHPVSIALDPTAMGLLEIAQDLMRPNCVESCEPCQLPSQFTHTLSIALLLAIKVSSILSSSSMIRFMIS